MSRSVRACGLRCGVSIAAFAAFALPASAQEAVDVEAVIVTASKRAEDIQDVPMSVSAVSGALLEKRGVSNVAELSRFVPSLSITQSNNNRNSTVFIRGIGTSGTNPGIEPSVGIFIDGVYVLAAGPIQSNLADINTIEVLRGPQGTLYGRNTPVGAINLTTREPTFETEGMFTASYGNYDEVRLSGYVGGGLSETVAARITGYYHDRSGYEHNLFDGEDTNDSSQFGFRGRVMWTPNDRLKANLIGYYSHLKANCCSPETVDPTGRGGIATPGFLAAAQALGLPFRNFDDHDRVLDDANEGRTETDIYGASVTLDYQLPGDHQLTSITAFNGYEDNVRSLGAVALRQRAADLPQRIRSEGWSQELRIASPTTGRFSYLGGLYLFSQDITYTSTLRVFDGANRVVPGNLRFSVGDSSTFYYTQDTRSWAAFGQATFRLTDTLRLQGGLRYGKDRKNAFFDNTLNATASAAFKTLFVENHLGKVRRSEDNVTYNVGAQFDLSDTAMVYLTYGTGVKNGGFNARGAAPGVPVEFDEENSSTIELGLKSTWFGRRLVFNADIYRMKLTNFQDAAVNPITGLGFVVANVGDRRAQGFEAEVTARPTDELTLRGSLGYTDGEYTDYPAGQCNALKTPNGSRAGTCNYNGLTPAQSPKWAGSVAAEYVRALDGTQLDGFVNVDASYTGGKYIEPLLDPRGYQPSIWLLGARVGVASQDGRWRLSAYGKNLTNETYYLHASAQSLGPLVSGGGTSGVAGFTAWYAPPRTYGLELTAKF
jgi:iron complex outermembrane receptor protein